jgi:hypothetical protein
MRRLFNFNEFVNESSAAGNMDSTYHIPFKYTSNDPKEGYNSKSFVDDLKSVFVEKPELKKEITTFISTTMRISNIDDLSTRPFSEIIKIIPEIERIIEAGEYEPELKMPGGAILFIRNKILKNGRGADFYMNSHGTKIEVVTEDVEGNEKVMVFRTEEFPFERFDFTDEEKQETEDLVKEKRSNS